MIIFLKFRKFQPEIYYYLKKESVSAQTFQKSIIIKSNTKKARMDNLRQIVGFEKLFRKAWYTVWREILRVLFLRFPGDPQKISSRR